MDNIIIYHKETRICPAGRQMDLSVVGPHGLIVSFGALSQESARAAFVLPDGTFKSDMPIEMEGEVGCFDCPVDGCNLTSLQGKER